MFTLIFFTSVATEDLKDAYGHVICTGELYFKGNYLKTIRCHSKNYKQFKVMMICYLIMIIMICYLIILSLVTFTIHTIILMKICRLVLTFIMLFYWNGTIEFVGKTCNCFSCCSFKMFWFAECMELNLPVLTLFYQNIWRRRLEEKLEKAKYLFFSKLRMATDFFKVILEYLIEKWLFFDAFSGFKSRHFLLTVLSKFLYSMICRKICFHTYVCFHVPCMSYSKWHVCATRPKLENYIHRIGKDTYD